jgi:hypothetical protein
MIDEMRRQARIAIDPLLLRFRQELFGSGVSFGTIQTSVLPVTIVYSGSLDPMNTSLGFIKGITTLSGVNIIGTQQTELSFVNAQVVSSGNRTTVTINLGATHTHPLSQIEQSGAQEEDTVRWNGANWVATNTLTGTTLRTSASATTNGIVWSPSGLNFYFNGNRQVYSDQNSFWSLRTNNNKVTMSASGLIFHLDSNIGGHISFERGGQIVGLFSGDNGQNIVLRSNPTSGSGTIWVESLSNNLPRIVNTAQNGSNTFYLVITPSGASAAINFTPPVAQSTLDIYGGIILRSGALPSLPNTLPQGTIFLMGTGSNSPAGRLFIGGDNFRISNNNTTSPTDFVTFTSQGRVGIGVVDPASTLQVNGPITLVGGHTNSSITGTGGITIHTGGFSSPTAGKTIFGDGTGWMYYFSRRVGGVDTDLVQISDVGRVGIGPGAFGSLSRLRVKRQSGDTDAARIEGTSISSHFFWGASEETYIRSGSNSRVIICDVNNGTFSQCLIGETNLGSFNAFLPKLSVVPTFTLGDAAWNNVTNTHFGVKTSNGEIGGLAVQHWRLANGNSLGNVVHAIRRLHGDTLLDPALYFGTSPTFGTASLGLNVTPSDYALQLSNVADQRGRILANAYLTYSSAANKENIRDVGNVLEKFKAVKVRKWKHKNETKPTGLRLVNNNGNKTDSETQNNAKEKTFGDLTRLQNTEGAQIVDDQVVGEEDFGFVAEELIEIFPEAVNGRLDKPETVGVNLKVMLAFAVQAIKELTQKVEELERRSKR